MSYVKNFLFILFILGIGCGGTTTTPTSNSATLTWDIPTTNADGTSLLASEIGGYIVYYGTSSGNYSTTKDVATTDCQTITCSITIKDLSSGTYYFTVTASDTSKNESDYSNEVSKTIQ